MKNNEPSMSQPVKDEEDGQWGMFGESIAEFERCTGSHCPAGQHGATTGVCASDRAELAALRSKKAWPLDFSKKWPAAHPPP